MHNDEFQPCGACGCKTVSGHLTPSGRCHDCDLIENDRYEEMMRRRYEDELRQIEAAKNTSNRRS